MENSSVLKKDYVLALAAEETEITVKPEEEDEEKRLKAQKASCYKKLQETSTGRLVSYRYFYACAVYLVYATAMLTNDYQGNLEEQNHNYLVYAVIHVINSCMFLWSWSERNYYEVECWPEYLNIIGSALWLNSSLDYPFLYTSNDDAATFSESFYHCRRVELAAAAVELAACIGWALIWYKGYVESLDSETHLPPPSRGFCLGT